MQLRHLSAFCLLFAVLSAGAENVSKSRAHEVAQSFFSQTKAGSANLNLVWTGEENGSSTKTSSDDSVPFYVFNNSEGGFVIISGEDTVTPVLGYSYSDSFVTENMPEHVADWFRQIKTFINKGRETGAKALSSTVEAWKMPLAAASAKLVGTPDWGQIYPCNEKCPKTGETTAVTGCVATAMAEILWRLEYPSAFIGEIPGYTTSSLKLKIDAHTSKAAYNWKQMPSESPYERAWTADNKEQVSALMYDCGTAVEMDYNTSTIGSSAFSESVPSALVKYFGIDKALLFDLACHYSTSDWLAKIKNCLDENIPVYYSSMDRENGGHAFVVDGYDKAGNLHINFGWFGMDNGYYAFPKFAVDEYAFSYYHQAIFGIKPDVGGQVDKSLSFDKYHLEDCGLVPSVFDIKPGVRFDIRAEGLFYNTTYAEDTYKSSVAMARYDKDGNFKELIFKETSIDELDPGKGYYGLSFTGCNCTSISSGDRAVMVHKPAGTTEWIAVKTDKEDPCFATEVLLSSKISPSSIAAGTSFKYDKETKILEINSIDGAIFRVYDEEIYPLEDGLEVTGNKLTLDCTKINAGETYMVFINKDNRVYSFDFVL